LQGWPPLQGLLLLLASLCWRPCCWCPTVASVYSVARESLVSDIPAGDGKTASLFFTVYARTVQTKLSKYRCRTAIVLLNFFTSSLLINTQWLFFRQTLRQIIPNTLLKQTHNFLLPKKNRNGGKGRMLCIWFFVLSVGWFSVVYPLPKITCMERTNRANMYSICMAANHARNHANTVLYIFYYEKQDTSLFFSLV
jgi:hypothetical protein